MTGKTYSRREAIRTGAAAGAFAGVTILAAKKTRAAREQKLVYWHLPTFAPAADEIRHEVLRAFPGATITFQVDPKRQGIVDSWPEDIDDGAARRDWGFNPSYDLDRAVREYVVPQIRAKYKPS